MTADPATAEGKPRRLRVLHVRNSDRFGGPERLLVDQVRRSGPGIDARIVSFGRRGRAHPFLDAARAEGIACELLPQSGSYDPATVHRFRSLLRRRAPDLLVGHDYKANALLALAAGKRPRVAVLHGYTGEDAKIRLFEAVDRRLIPGAAAIVVVSDVLRDAAIEAGAKAERVHRIPNGIDVERVARAAAEGRAELRATWGLSPDAFAVIALGRLSPEKGQDVLLDAFARLPGTSPAHLVLVGDGALDSELRARTEEADLRGRVTFAGWRSDPHACLGAADLFALPSRSEGLPLALLEAMAAGVPALATDVGAVAEVLDRGRAGRVVTPGDVDAFAGALADLLEDPTARDEAASIARSRVVEHYDVAVQASRLEEIYRAAVNANTRAD